MPRRPGRRKNAGYSPKPIPHFPPPARPENVRHRASGLVLGYRVRSSESDQFGCTYSRKAVNNNRNIRITQFHDLIVAVIIVIDWIDCARFRFWNTRSDYFRFSMSKYYGDGSHRSVTYDENDSER